MNAVTIPFFISHHGCPHKCVFCDQRIISSSSGALPDASTMLDKVADWKNSAGQRSLEAAFFGGTFTALPLGTQERLLVPLQPLLKNGELASVRISTRPDSIDAGCVAWLAAHGVKTIELGVQSMDDGVLEQTGRGYDSACVEDAIRCVKSGGLSVVAQLMPGLPGDSTEKSLLSLKMVIEAGACQVRIYPAIVLAGTELAMKYQAGEYVPLLLEEGISVSKVMLLYAMRAGVDVIRIGLQADEGLNADNILAGCWHPALGQLVRSELFFDLILQTLPKLARSEHVNILCHHGMVSDVVGHSRRNQERLAAKGIHLERVIPDQGYASDEIGISCLNECIKVGIVTDLNYELCQREADARSANF